MALTMSAPAVAATPTDSGIYEAVKASIDAPAILQVHEDAVALTCEAPAATLSRADGRSSFPGETMNVADAAGSRLHFVEVRRRC